MGIFLLGMQQPYRGLVASRARMLTNTDTTNKQIMGSYGVISTEALTSIRVLSSNFFLGDPDTGLGTAATISTGVQLGSTFWQANYSGSVNGTIPDADFLESDDTAVSIPAFTPFSIRQFYRNSAGVMYFNGQNSFFGEATNAAISGLTDQTMGGTISNTQPTWGLPPLAVTAMTRNASAIPVGDSLAFGTNDIEDGSSTITGFNGKKGLITPSLGSVPFLNLAIPSETAQFWGSRATSRQKLIKYGSHLITQLGINDLDVNSRTPSQVKSDLQAIWAFARAGQKVYQTTITPHASDPNTPAAAFTTTGQQTATNLAGHAGMNQLIRGGITGMTGYYDTASVFENTQDSDIWKPHTPAYCDTGGLHPVVAGYALVPPSGVISPVAWP